MKQMMKNHISLIPFYIVLFFSIVWLGFFYKGGFNRLFITSDQLGYYYYKKKAYDTSAQTFENLSFKGASYYRSASFKKAQASYLNLSSKEDRYNTGNTLLMLGLYDLAIESYTMALKIDPHFIKAKDNLIIAKARKILKKPENDGEEGVGELGADQIVFDNKESKGVDDDTSTQKETESGNPNWLDRLQTGPKDFLKNKFRYQYEMQGSKDAK